MMGVGASAWEWPAVRIVLKRLESPAEAGWGSLPGGVTPRINAGAKREPAEAGKGWWGLGCGCGCGCGWGWSWGGLGLRPGFEGGGCGYDKAAASCRHSKFAGLDLSFSFQYNRLSSTPRARVRKTVNEEQVICCAPRRVRAAPGHRTPERLL